MGIADDILKKGFRNPSKVATRSDVASEVLDKSYEAAKIAADQQPGIGALEPPSTRRDQIVNLVQQTSVTLSAPTNDAPTGLETAPVSRIIPRKRQILLTSTPLGANGVFTSPWIDTELDGGMYLLITSSASSSNIITSGLQVQETEDQLAAGIRTIAAQGGVTLCRQSCIVRARYWRVVYTNSATPLVAPFSIYATVSSTPFMGTPFTNGTNPPESVVIATDQAAAATAVDGIGNQLLAQIKNQAGSGTTQQNIVLLFNGATWDRMRTPAIFKQASTAATGSTALWTPAAGKKFRIMRYRVQMTARALAAVAADLTINLLDAAANLGLATITSVPAAGLTAGDDYDSGWIDLGNGILSAAANNVLNINLSFALTGGLVNVNVCGTEE
jgi:hypothetical protein